MTLDAAGDLAQVFIAAVLTLGVPWAMTIERRLARVDVGLRVMMDRDKALIDTALRELEQRLRAVEIARGEG